MEFQKYLYQFKNQVRRELMLIHMHLLELFQDQEMDLLEWLNHKWVEVSSIELHKNLEAWDHKLQFREKLNQIKVGEFNLVELHLLLTVLYKIFWTQTETLQPVWDLKDQEF